MSERTTGRDEPAFPPFNPRFAPGMTLRDYFAAQVLAGMMSGKAWWDQTRDLAEQELPGRGVEYTEALLAVKAYAMADAMLKAREQTDE